MKTAGTKLGAVKVQNSATGPDIPDILDPLHPTQKIIMLPNIVFAAALLSLTSASPVQPSTRASCADSMSLGGSPFSMLADANSKIFTVTVVFARGTTEIGDLGTLVGPPFQSAIKSAIGSATLNMMGVPAPAYAADIPGFLAGGSAPVVLQWRKWYNQL
jgi:hypothetical protein